MPGLALSVLQTPLAIVRLEPTAPVPAWAWSGEVCAVTRTASELSVVCGEACVPPDALAQRGWRALMVDGRLEFSLTGVLAALAGPLADASVSIFALSTYDTDYVLVGGEDLARACAALTQAGHAVSGA